MDGGGVSRHQGETRRQRGRVPHLGMGRHSHKRHVLRERPSESHCRRRRLIPHRLGGEAQERQTPRSLEGVACQIRRVDRQEGFDIALE